MGTGLRRGGRPPPLTAEEEHPCDCDGAFGAIVSTALVTMAGLGWQAGSAGAATAATTASINPADAGWTGNLHIPRFDPANGSLVSAEVTVTVTTEATIKLENLESFPVTSDPADPNAYEIAIGGDVDFDLAVVPGLAEIGFPDPVFAEVVPSGISLAAFDGVTDFGGPSGYTKVLTATSVRTATATDLESLAPFIGTGELVIAATRKRCCRSAAGSTARSSPPRSAWTSPSSTPTNGPPSRSSCRWPRASHPSWRGV